MIKSKTFLAVSVSVCILFLSMSLFYAAAQDLLANKTPSASTYTVFTDNLGDYIAETNDKTQVYTVSDAYTIINDALQHNLYTPITIDISDGTYPLKAPLIPADGDTITGDSLATILEPMGNFSAIDCDNMGYITISNLGIRGTGQAGGSIGIQITMSNYVTISYVTITSCNVGILINGAYQTKIDHVMLPYSIPSDQCYNGIQAIYNPLRVNEVAITNTQIQSPVNDGIIIQGGDGVYCAGTGVEMAGNIGFLIGGESGGGVTHYVHFDQTWADAGYYSSGIGYVFQGNTNASYIYQLTNMWAMGYAYGAIFNNIKQTTIDNFYGNDIQYNGIVIGDCQDVSITGGTMVGWDRGDTGTCTGIYIYNDEGVASDININGMSFVNTHTAASSIYVGPYTMRTTLVDCNTAQAQPIIDQGGLHTEVSDCWNSTTWINNWGN